MIFTIGAILFLLGYVWYAGTEYTKDWRDTVQFGLMVVGAILLTISLSILSLRYLP
jgi:multisubunit Na+/H+ antiporter MnhB subunit